MEKEASIAGVTYEVVCAVSTALYNESVFYLVFGYLFPWTQGTCVKIYIDIAPL